MIKSCFFNSEGGDRQYLAEDFAKYFSSFIGNGVFPNPSDNFQVIEKAGMQIDVKSGKGWINGYFVENTDLHTLNIDPADGVINRKDRIVLRLDYSGRAINLLVRKGDFATNPTAPEVVRNADFYELSLAVIAINAGITNITQAEITDTRQDSGVCGLVTGTVDQIDATNLFAQYDSAFNQWFEDVQNTLSGDVAANLLNLINTNTSAIADINSERELTGTLTIPASGWSTDGAGDYPRYITISIADITADHWVEISIDREDLETANDAEICPTIEEVAGGVKLYAKKELSADVSARYKVVI